MINIMLDQLPTDWKGYPISASFRTGIKMSMCMSDPDLSDMERFYIASYLLFPEKCPEPQEAAKAIEWFMTEFNHDNYQQKKNEDIIMDWDMDQWRIYAAFRNQYHIDLQKAEMHWFVFMGLLGNLQESSLTHVMDIRQKKITSKMSQEEKNAYRSAKKIFAIKAPKDEKITPEEQARIDEFMKYAKINKSTKSQ